MDVPQHSLPRLYVSHVLAAGLRVAPQDGQSHYLLHVMRLKDGDGVRLFNGVDGEFRAICHVLSKHKLEWECVEKLREQPLAPQALHLLFAPIQKARMDFLIEKAVELGVTAFHPVLTARGQVRKLNTERVEAQIIEAAEQCERLELPVLHEIVDLKRGIVAWRETPVIHWAAERLEMRGDIAAEKDFSAFLVGPEGGFDAAEIAFLSAQPCIRPISLGARILRAETAVLKCLAHANV